MATGTWNSGKIRIAVGFNEADWEELNRLSQQTNIPVSTLIRNLTLKGLKEVTNA